MKTNPYFLIFTLMGVSVVVFGFAVRIAEAPLYWDDNYDFPIKLESQWNSMWNIIITMTTVGYGDYSAKTELGRIIIFIVCIWGSLIVSLMVVTLTNTLTTNSFENKAIAVLNRLLQRQINYGYLYKIITLVTKISLQKQLNSASQSTIER